MQSPPPAAPASFRLDKWLWQARFFKSRSMAAAVCRLGSLRVNGQAINKPNETVKLGDVLTIPLGPSVKVVCILGFGDRRGPFSEAATLYQEIKSGLKPTI
jgi:ribosome-associated heat shock protein Hsp15